MLDCIKVFLCNIVVSPVSNFSYHFLQGYRTGYIYKHPLVKEELMKPKSDVEVPPAVSSLGYLLEEEALYKDGYVR